MLIEYKIKFENDGVTITQRVEPGVSASGLAKPTARAGAEIAGSLGSSFKRDEGGEGSDPVGPGSGGPPASGPGKAPIIVLGPIVMCGSTPTETVLVAPPPTEKSADEKGAKDSSAGKTTATHGAS